MERNRMKCVSDRWDRDGTLYDDVADFTAMCVDVFGVAPRLTNIDGVWYETAGDARTAVLVPEGREDY